MENLKCICLIFLMLVSSYVFGQHAAPTFLERTNIKDIDGVWLGLSDKGDSLQLDLKVSKVALKGNIIMDQLVGEGYLNGNKVVLIDGVEDSEQNEFLMLKFWGYDIAKDKRIYLHLKLLTSEPFSGELEVTNRETVLVNGKSGNKTWDPEISIDTKWKLIKKR
ncbi:hypothetical protein [Mongoliitalea daihaiensis]|uniref:hypothetical protein n=1 Tax=Mongoliitalea daihaiensis TaxID=2782006 RepID=UPI001F234DD1|nr:hypothetical protein [Mongoliitalea daihaiensis]UJP63701.1 hypothetical protein IPZ59_12760 [Mongoliitalea daihaiensis]